jgi:hypothetical protein
MRRSAFVRPAPVIVACCSDSDRPAFRRVVRAIARRRPNLVLFAGDARARGVGLGPLASHRWRRTWGPLASRVLTVPGNHDYAPGATRSWVWRGKWTSDPRFVPHEESGAFVLHLPGLSVLGLDCGARARAVSGAQLDWARRAMSAGPAGAHRIAIFHAPAFPVSHHIGASLDALPHERDALWRSLEDMAIRLVINGHEHVYARRTIVVRRPIVQVISAGAGAALSPVLASDLDAAESCHHALVVNSSNDVLAAEAFTPGGRVLDRFTVCRGD